MPGTIAANAHEGTRSEYLALYVFSALGTAVPVPHPEDSGIDLYCTLGKHMGRLLSVENYFLVQVKSKKEPIRYKTSDEAQWLLSHHYPILICYVDKTAGKVEIYQTLSLSFLYTKTNINSITLSPSSPPDANKQFTHHTGETDPIIYMGRPILRFDVAKVGSKDWREKSRTSLRAWIEIDRENIAMRSTGFPLFRHPLSYQTNASEIDAKSFTGNFKDTDSSLKLTASFYDVLMRQLTQLTNLAAAEKNLARLNSIAMFVKSLSDHQQIPETWGAMIFGFCYGEACKHLGVHPLIVLNKIKPIPPKASD
jgi:hypothetical protein